MDVHGSRDLRVPHGPLNRLWIDTCLPRTSMLPWTCVAREPRCSLGVHLRLLGCGPEMTADDVLVVHRLPLPYRLEHKVFRAAGANSLDPRLGSLAAPQFNSTSTEGSRWIRTITEASTQPLPSLPCLRYAPIATGSRADLYARRRRSSRQQPKWRPDTVQ